MYSVTINGKETLKTLLKVNDDAIEGTVNGEEISGNLVRISDHEFHLIMDSRSVSIQVISVNRSEKKMVLQVNSTKCEITLRDQYDELLHKLGMDELTSKKISDIKAPMPGMILEVMAGEGQQVKKGDVLIVLEAMKMENIIRAPGDGVVKKVVAKKGNAVEKNQLLIQF
jgi:biotin carboxyl carrier protein